jgi:Putative DNA-binding domain
MTQGDFRDALLDPDRSVPPGLVDPSGRPAGRRFDVYRNNVTAGLTEALRQAFPVIRALVGEEFFTAMARDHLRAHPPRSPMLMLYGEDMPAFLASFPPVAHLGYLPDMARLELALRHAYHAADARPVGADRLQALAADDLMASRLTFAPAVRLVRSAWPIHSIWMANTRGATPPATKAAEDVLVVRPGFDAQPLLLPPGAAPFLDAMLRGQTFSAALDGVAPFDLTAVLTLLLQGGAIVDTPNGPPS